MLYIVTESSMFDFFKGKKGKADKVEAKPEELTQDQPIAEEEPQKLAEEILPAAISGLLKRMQEELRRTRGSLSEGLSSLLLGKKEINEDLLEELETQLLMADVGIETTQAITDKMHSHICR